MGLLLDVIKVNALDDHPFPSLSHCVNRNQKHVSCSACMDICPKGVYDPAQKTPPDWSKCQNCGLCVSACTARCIALSPTNAKRHLLLAEKQGEILLSCRRSEKQAGHIEECLALLPWEFLAYLALGGRLTLNLHACRTCGMDACLELLEEQLYRLKCFLGEEGYARHVHICMDSEADAPQEGVSRRDFFKSVALGGKRTTALVLGDAAGSRVDAMIYRRLLAGRVKEIAENGEDADCRMRLPWFDETCYGCGLCAMLCPNRAIEVGGEEEGTRTMYVTPHLCTGCGVCAAVCRDGCIEIADVKLPNLNRLAYARVASRSCARCGRAIPPKGEETLCTACRYTKKK